MTAEKKVFAKNRPVFGKSDFARIDETPDELFYNTPRLVTHVDDAACAALTAFYAQLFCEGDIVLDLMSSCVSHLPPIPKLAKVTGHGMNAQELGANSQLDEYFVQNLNASPLLPLDNGKYDTCLVAVSVQYLTNPIEVFTEIGRILKPGGMVVVSFSNRMFLTKATAIWRTTDDAGHGHLVRAYLEETSIFKNIQIMDISPALGAKDPLFTVVATVH